MGDERCAVGGCTPPYPRPALISPHPPTRPPSLPLQLVIKTCHKRGVHAIGGMSALIPVKGDAAANEVCALCYLSACC